MLDLCHPSPNWGAGPYVLTWRQSRERTPLLRDRRWEPQQGSWHQDMGAASLTTADDCPGETGLLSEEVMASWGNGRGSQAAARVPHSPHQTHVLQESRSWAPMCLLLRGFGDPEPSLSWRCPQNTACDLTWHVQGCTKARGALKIL